MNAPSLSIALLLTLAQLPGGLRLHHLLQEGQGVVVHAVLAACCLGVLPPHLRRVILSGGAQFGTLNARQLGLDIGIVRLQKELLLKACLRSPNARVRCNALQQGVGRPSRGFAAMRSCWQ